MDFFFGMAVEFFYFAVSLIIAIILGGILQRYILRGQQCEEVSSPSEIFEKTKLFWDSFNGTCKEIRELSEREKNLKDKEQILVLIQRLSDTAEILMMGPAYEAVTIMYHCYRNIAEEMLKEREGGEKDEKPGTNNLH